VQPRILATGRVLATGRALLLALCCTILTLGGLQAQTADPTSSAEQDTVNAIKAFAERHVKAKSPLQTQLVVAHFTPNQAGLSSQRIAEIYEQEYVRLSTKTPDSTWDKLAPKLGWAAAGILLLAIVFRKLLEEMATKFLRFLGRRLFNRLAGMTFMRPLAMKHYRKALYLRYKQVQIAFRPQRPMEMVTTFVPLSLDSSRLSVSIVSTSLLERYTRILVLGQPGSGKSMILRNILYSYSTIGSSWRLRENVPVVVELHRLSDRSVRIFDCIVDEFARNNFKSAAGFVQNNLDIGRVALLLDGFDEVASTERTRVALMIQDFLLQYRRCNAVITCRTAVYHGEFDSVIDDTLHVLEMSDIQMFQFLQPWQNDMPAGKSAEQLMLGLHDRPRILTLARNPLLLSIIAYLYADTEFVIPHSRAEFYQKAATLLLEQWHYERNQFTASDKQIVLQHIALANHDDTTTQTSTVRVVPATDLFAMVQLVLPRLNLRAGLDARSMVSEIVERSGLLLSVDGGQGFQFAHLTLQEYFSAAELIDRPSDLVARFQKDADRWREPLKLWCGLANDATLVLKAIRSDSEITALECVADARQIEDVLSDSMISSFLPRLSNVDVDDAVVRAIAAVASDLRPRGARVFEELCNQLEHPSSASHARAVARALSLTNVTRAAEVLSRLRHRGSFIQEALVRMGDVAVPALVRQAQIGDIEAITDLHVVGTPAARRNLVQLLFVHNPEVSGYAALWLMASLMDSDTENILRDYREMPLNRETSEYTWVWKPYQRDDNDMLPVIVGKMVDSVVKFNGEFSADEQVRLDARILIPMTIIILRKEFRGVELVSSDIGRERLEKWREQLLAPPAIRLFRETDYQAGLMNRQSEVDPEFRSSWLSRAIDILMPTSKGIMLLKRIPDAFAQRVVEFLLENHTCTPSDWQGSFHPEYKDLRRDSLAMICGVIGILVSITAITCGALLAVQLSDMRPVVAITVIMGSVSIVYWWWWAIVMGGGLSEGPFDLSGLAFLECAYWWVPWQLLLALRDVAVRSRPSSEVERVMLPAIPGSVSSVVFPSMLSYLYFGVIPAAILAVLVVAIGPLSLYVMERGTSRHLLALRDLISGLRQGA
jgi:hypothetical protein